MNAVAAGGFWLSCGNFSWIADCDLQELLAQRVLQPLIRRDGKLNDVLVSGRLMAVAHNAASDVCRSISDGRQLSPLVAKAAGFRRLMHFNQVLLGFAAHIHRRYPQGRHSGEMLLAHFHP